MLKLDYTYSKKNSIITAYSPAKGHLVGSKTFRNVQNLSKWNSLPPPSSYFLAFSTETSRKDNLAIFISVAAVCSQCDSGREVVTQAPTAFFRIVEICKADVRAPVSHIRRARAREVFREDVFLERTIRDVLWCDVFKSRKCRLIAVKRKTCQRKD